MALDMGKWKGMFEWSMKFQDGSRPTDYGSLEEMPADKREWLEKAMGDLMKDLGDRMREIKTDLDGSDGQTATATSPGRSNAASAVIRHKEALLDELAEIVESVDQARDLNKIGGLDTLISLMACPAPSLRWRAAEVAATCMANNPPVQRWFMDGGAAPALMALLEDCDATCRAKALHALSALVRHYDPGLEAFRAAGGLAHLLEIIGAVPSASEAHASGGAPNNASGSGHATAAATGPKQQQHQQEEEDMEVCSSGSEEGAGPGAAAAVVDEETEEERRAAAAAAARRLWRKALALLHYVCAKRPTDAAAAAAADGVSALTAVLTDPSSDSDTRTAALAVLLELAATPAGWSAAHADAHGSHGAQRLPAALAALQARHAALEDPEDREAEADELEAAEKLLAALAAPAPRGVGRGAGGAEGYDHVDLDPWQDGQEASKTVAVGSGRQGSGGGGAVTAVGQQHAVAPVLGLPAPPPSSSSA